MNFENEIIGIAKRARAASRATPLVSRGAKDRALENIARELLRNKGYLLRANGKDVEAARRGNLSDAFIDRLTLNERRINDMAGSLRKLMRLEDPVGVVIKAWRRPNGLVIKKVRVPIGVILVIYESRPNVTVDFLRFFF